MVFFQRKAGVLLPVFSLPGEYGIGGFGNEAYSFIDSLKAGGQSFWQVLPQNPTSYGDSPYQSFSTFAGNPYFISLEKLIEQRLLTKQECDEAYFGDNSSCIDYKAMYDNRFKLLKKAFQRDAARYSKEYKSFERENDFWLCDYSLFMALKDKNAGISWQEWENSLKYREKNAVQNAKENLQEEIDFYKYIQFQFFAQWKALKAYANQNKIEIIGDIPIYVALDSADVWVNPKLFDLDEQLQPKDVAGCPPDAFCRLGQLWGNPLYRWKNHKATGFDWWIKRMRQAACIYDIVRIDHFRGFDEYYAVPFGDKTAENGIWLKGVGIELFDAIKSAVGEVKIIAEDLGQITPTVRELLCKTGYPGMKIMQFAFSKGYESDYLLHRHIKDCVVYTGTHDNRTSKGWFNMLNDDDKEYAGQYMAFGDAKWDKDKFLHHTMSSVANLVIIPMQDYLDLGDEARINVPSTLGENWRWRMKKDELSESIILQMKTLTQIYYR